MITQMQSMQINFPVNSMKRACAKRRTFHKRRIFGSVTFQGRVRSVQLLRISDKPLISEGAEFENYDDISRFGS